VSRASESHASIWGRKCVAYLRGRKGVGKDGDGNCHTLVKGYFPKNTPCSGTFQAASPYVSSASSWHYCGGRFPLVTVHNHRHCVTIRTKFTTPVFILPHEWIRDVI
jgi:hypothetical protein